MFLGLCFIIRLCWGIGAYVYGCGNRGRAPRPTPNPDAERAARVRAPFDFMIDSLSAGDDAEGEVEDLLAAESPWSEQWDDSRQAWYYWNTETNEVRAHTPPPPANR